MADSKKYRDEAEHLRREAAETTHRDIRGTMIEVAELYDRLANILEQRQDQSADPQKTGAGKPTGFHVVRLLVATMPFCATLSRSRPRPKSDSNVADSRDTTIDYGPTKRK